MTDTGHTMTCGEMVEYLSDYLDGALRDDLRSLIDSHRGDCPPCEAFIRTLARTVEIVRAQPREPLSADLKRALIASLRKGTRGRDRSS